MTERKLTTENLKRMALALQNSYEWQARLFRELIQEIDGGNDTTPAAAAPAKKGKSRPVESEEMESVESPFNDVQGEDVQEEPKKTKGKKAAAPAPANDADDMFGDEGEAEINEPTLDDVRKAIKDFATKHGKEKALKLLGKFKVTSIPDIKKQDYAKVIELAKKYL
jgi:hypothetical protein